MQDQLLTIKEAAAYIGKQPQILRRMVYSKLLPRVTTGNNRLLFKRSDLDRIKMTRYVMGMSHTEIAAQYGVGRTLVVHHFKRLNVKPIGTYRGNNNADIYDPATVAKFAKVLGWVQVHPDKNLPDES